MHNKRVLNSYISEKPKGRANKSKERAKRRVGRARSKKEGKRRAWEGALPPPKKRAVRQLCQELSIEYHRDYFCTKINNTTFLGHIWAWAWGGGGQMTPLEAMLVHTICLFDKIFPIFNTKNTTHSRFLINPNKTVSLIVGKNKFTKSCAWNTGCSHTNATSP